ncbi:hypothetical protein [Burkholderia sp. L27(2015)]|uniref:hypothetical protein n=1 Tax=Burkholderia sp. L27(2015) TaxID=1641858 RepID=UPI00131D5DA6|nr:hypothetical protein [Burkholderia sp. L27(2015)]
MTHAPRRSIEEGRVRRVSLGCPLRGISKLAAMDDGQYKTKRGEAVANQNGPANFLDTTAADACVMGIITGFLPISLRLAIRPIPITHTLWRKASLFTHAAERG